MSPKPVRRITILLLRLGVAGLFAAALAMTFTGFALFGCQNCQQSNGASRTTEGMIVNPPDPPAQDRTRPPVEPAAK